MWVENMSKDKMNYSLKVDTFMPLEITVPVDRSLHAERKLDEIELKRKYKEAYSCIEEEFGA